MTIDITQEKEHDALYVELQNEAASLDTIHEMLGYRSTEDFPDVLESWSDLLHPDDKDRVLDEFNETISDYTGQKTYDVEYRLLTKNRGYRWYRAVSPASAQHNQRHP